MGTFAPGSGRPEGAVLHPAQAERTFTRARHEASPELAPFVEYLWSVEWDLRGREPFEQRVLSSPHLHLTVEPERSRVTGILTEFDFAYTLRDAGRAVGVRFRPGGFRPFLHRPVSDLTDRWVPVADVLPWADATIGPAVQAAATSSDAAAILDAAVLELSPTPDPAVDEVADIVDAVGKDPTLLRVDALAERAGRSVRALQRLFGEYVGASPKWVIRSARLHETAGRAASGQDVDWAGLAAELGYSDQSHLVRDFTRTVGESPARYAELARREVVIPERGGSTTPGAVDPPRS